MLLIEQVVRATIQIGDGCVVDVDAQIAVERGETSWKWTGRSIGSSA